MTLPAGPAGDLELVEHHDDGTYTSHDAARILEEPDKAPWRGAFERDRARLVHSAALRRLGAKTQVMGPGSDDFVRTRLTHSLEVAQVGRELGAQLGCNPDVVDAACLSHDIGHPPFGHNGERALNEVAAGIGGFEGNAQTLRILTRLEAKRSDPQGRSVGLNLTRATLDATCKYPWRAGEGPDGPDGRPCRKFGVYADDARVFGWLRQGDVSGRKCLEAQVMDLSDDIAYSVHDVEDGIAGGRIDPAALPGQLDAVVDSTLEWFGGGIPVDEVGAALERILESPVWVGEFNWSRAGLADLKNMTSALIGRFSRAAHAATRAITGAGRLARYNASLVVPGETAAEILALKGLAVHFVMRPREHEPLYLTQRTVIFDLVDALLEAGASEMEPEYQDDFLAASGDDERLRVVVDQVASLTDYSAHKWHARLCGMFSTAL
ncbi:MAG TPA: deoxyguanosinetriphosphate triphosphohydrolase [Actinomycetaceae bacterium]|nr:deoxyguanosinetriphosphate triphosphohydrolase [Actinomycetaceae bacterium]